MMQMLHMAVNKEEHLLLPAARYGGSGHFEELLAALQCSKQCKKKYNLPNDTTLLHMAAQFGRHNVVCAFKNVLEKWTPVFALLLLLMLLLMYLCMYAYIRCQ